MRKDKLSSRDMVLSAMGTVIIILCSWLNLPTLVPVTMQTFGVILVSLVLGKRCGIYSLLGYCLLGLAGLPVFAGFKSGAAVLAGPTGGFIIGLFAIPIIIGYFYYKNYEKWMLLALLMGIMIMYISGTLWYVVIYTQGNVGLGSAVSVCVLPFIIPDLIKCILAMLCAKKIKKSRLLLTR